MPKKPAKKTVVSANKKSTTKKASSATKAAKTNKKTKNFEMDEAHLCQSIVD